MKLKNKILLFAVTLSAFALSSCTSEKMEWNDPYTHPDLNDLPLSLQEKISLYGAINSYSDFKIGAGIDLNLYANDEAFRALVDANFDEIVPGNELKPSALMTSSGKLDFTRTDAALARLSPGFALYGHVLVWHQQVQGGYLNSLIAPKILPGPAGESLVDGSFENISTIAESGWTPAYYAENYTIATTESIDGTQSLKVIIPAEATGGKYDGHGQLRSPTFPIIAGHRYQVSFWIKGSVPGKIAIDFPNGNLGNQYPWVNGSDAADVSTTWTQVVYNTQTSGDPAMIATVDNPAMTVRLLLAIVPNVTYYIDAIEITDLDALPTEVNLVENGNFETGAVTPFATPNVGGGITVDGGAAFAGSYGLKAVSSATSANEWDLQFQTPEIALDPDKEYTMSFYIKSDIAGQGRISFSGFSNEYPWTNWDGSGTASSFSVSSTWKAISFDFTPVYKAGASAVKLSFDLGKLPNVTYFVDDIKLVEKPAVEPATRAITRAAITIDKTPEEKAHIVDSVLVSYVSGVAAHYKGRVTAWEVLNEPLNEDGTLRVGVENLKATTTFPWALYLGEDYAVTAFKTAREADPDAILFINDFNLESTNPAKLDGLIALVERIEAKGAQVDGIATQLHLNLNWSNIDAIEAMFVKLAATGKLIKVSELDIAISPEASAGNGPASPISPTTQQLERQAAMYEAVARLYTQIIPPAQQYGITVWGISDKVEEHTHWLPNDAPCLWNADYARKWAYKGFCDGLFGSDVSADWNYGDLSNASNK